MTLLSVYARLYAECLRRALSGIGKNPWTLLLPAVLVFAFGKLLLLMAVAIGSTLAGLLVGFLTAAAVSCYLYFLGRVLENSRARAREFSVALKAYFWSVLNILFVVWIAQLISGMVFGNLSQGLALGTAFWLGVVILCNATPEVIYLRGTYGGLATLQRSFHFLQENWIEWAVPNLLLLGLLYEIWTLPLPDYLSQVAFGAVLHLGMAFRGQLFLALDGSGHRQRMFRYRTGT